MNCAKCRVDLEIRGACYPSPRGYVCHECAPDGAGRIDCVPDEALEPVLDRATLSDLAREAVESLEHVPGLRVVVVVTDTSGTFLAVGTSTTAEDTAAILRAALEAKGREPA